MSAEKGADLPPGLDILWGRRERSRRGPKPALTVERIVEAAIEIADAEGLGPLSMSRLAEALGFTPMSLYRYVRNKDELLQLMGDINAPPPPSSAEQGWRDGLAGWAKGLFGHYREHPWVLHIPMRGMPPIGPNALRWLDAGLRCLAGTPLGLEDRINVITQLSVHIRGAAMFTAQYGQGADSDPASSLPYGDLLRMVVDAEHYPELSVVLDAGVFDGDDASYIEYDPDVEVEFGLNLFLDGVAALIAAQPHAEAARQQD